MSENTTCTVPNSVANLLALLLNQEGWVKGVDELIAAGDLLHTIPEPVTEDVQDGYMELVMTPKQLKAVKHCFSSIVEKGNLLANKNVLGLAKVAEFYIPMTDPTVTITLPQISAKYLADCFSMQGKIKKVEDLIAACQVLEKLPKLDQALTEKGQEVALKEWMDKSVTLEITERQRDVCRAILKAAAEDGSIRSNRYIPVLYTEFGLRE